MNFFLIKQLPIMPPEEYSDKDILFILPRTMELIYTSNSMRPWAEDVYSSAPEEVKAEILRFCNVPSMKQVCSNRSHLILNVVLC